MEFSEEPLPEKPLPKEPLPKESSRQTFNGRAHVIDRIRQHS